MYMHQILDTPTAFTFRMISQTRFVNDTSVDFVFSDDLNVSKHEETWLVNVSYSQNPANGFQLGPLKLMPGFPQLAPHCVNRESGCQRGTSRSCVPTVDVHPTER